MERLVSQVAAFDLPNPGHDLQGPPRHCGQRLHGIGPEFRGPELGMPRAEHQRRDLRREERPAAHRTRLHRGIERQARKIGSPQPRGGRADREQFGVGGWVVGGLDAIAPFAHHLALRDDHASRRAIPRLDGFASERDGPIHEHGVIRLHYQSGAERAHGTDQSDSRNDRNHSPEGRDVDSSG